MELQKILKKFIASMLLSVIIIGQLSGLKFKTEAVTVNSRDDEQVYLALSILRDEIGYAVDMTSNGTEGKNLWGIRKHESAAQNSASVVASNMYCIKGGFGYTWEDLGTPKAVVPYTLSTFNSSAVDGYYNELLWVIDHLYIPTEDNKDEFLKSVGIESYEDSGYKLYYYNPIPGYDYSSLSSMGEYIYTPTDDDIIAIQQAVIWHYTNYKIEPGKYGIYNKVGKDASWLKYTANETNYEELSSINSTQGEGQARSEFAIIIYNYLIEAAEKEVAKLGGTYTLKNKTVKLWTSNVNGGEEQPIIEIHKKPKTGKYNVVLVKEDENGEQLDSTATFIVDGVEKTVTGKLTIASDVQITKDNLSRTDTYTIKEKTPPDEYCEFDGIITVSVTKKETDDGYIAENATYIVKDEQGNDITSSTGDTVNVYVKDGNIYVEVKNYPEEKAFDLALRKVITEVKDEKRDIKAIVDANGNDATRNVVVDKSTLNNEDDNRGTDTATYRHRKDPVLVEKGDTVKYSINIYNEGEQRGLATKIVDQLPGTATNGLRLLSTADVVSSTGNTYKVDYSTTTNTVILTLKGANSQSGVQIPAYNGTTLSQETITLECKVTANINSKETTTLTNIAYIAEEYNAETNEVITTVGDRDSQPQTHPNYKNEDDTLQDGVTYGEDIGYTGHTGNPKDLSQNNTYYKGEQDDDDFEKLVILPKSFDLKLIKYIDEVNGEDTGNRILNVDTSKLNTTDKTGKLITTAEYEMEKNPVSVKVTDFIKYTIRIYNEGDFDGYATEISEDIPQGLEALIIDKDASGNIVIYSWDGRDLKDVTAEIRATNMYDDIVTTNSVWKHKLSSSIITTDALKDEMLKAFGVKGYTNYADNINKIDYNEISVIFRVKEDAVTEVQPIRNEAAITEHRAVDAMGNDVIDSTGNPIEDRDSYPEKWNKEDSGKDYNEDGWEIYKEDDEDYDNIIVKKFDLALRKQITKITRDGRDTLYTSRYANLDKRAKNTIYDYYNVYNNKPKVRAGDIVTYSIRVYNEGEIDGYVKLISDKLPSGLEFVPYTEGDGSINDKYRWKLVEGTTDVYETDYLSYEKDANRGTENSTIIKAYTGNGEADFEEVEIQCKVKDNVTKEDSLLNVAQISDDSDEKGRPIKDNDSTPGNTDDEKEWKKEDDLDIEILQLEEFDLSLKKFITEIEETGSENSQTEDGQIKKTPVTSRVPELTYDKNTNKIIYTHIKDPMIVHVGDTIIYTLRVYNEGDIDGYVQEVSDNIPEYLEFLPNHEINEEFEWEMYDAEGNKTDDVTKAVKVKTIHLAKGEGEEKGAVLGTSQFTANLIKAFNPTTGINATNPDYRDLKIAFKVEDPGSTEYIITNFAEISEDADEDGEPIDDIDSDPDNGDGEPKEDEEDVEKVKVEYFDLSLLKYVTKAIVTEEGKEVVIETGNIGDDNDIVPKVEVNKKKMDKTVVKFAYTIKITNEGNIAGYAKEITDYIPQGLEFKAEDNPNWESKGNGLISTRALENVLLQPGESTEVEIILTWINGEENFGSKINIAEISEDDNDKDVPDKDSTPDNEEDGEDDIDDSEIIISIITGGTSNISIIILMSVLFLIVLVGIIEKAVIERFLKK
ncbi:MAG: DUF11 domain-containing protein [Clostridia bacterium]|nr:DUF11 domain-containing protein [Clostridia bacterium]